MTLATGGSMTTATSEDTEITLGTGKMLALFFGLVALCAVFFAMGFSLGKNSVLKTPMAEIAPSITAAATRTAASKPSGSVVPADAATAKSTSDDQPETPAGDTTTAAQTRTPAPTPVAATTTPTPADPAAQIVNGYYVQVAAVSKQEDAEALVDALKKKQYPALTSTSAPDKLFHVQVGPYADVKEAEAMKSKLMGDGYNPILKK